jgi:succinate dehydrogenase / fumarate reductase flavoprotein subunit
VDIFVFGRRAGMDIARKIGQVKIGRLSLEHIKVYNEALQNAQIVSETCSPMLLPDYRFEKALTTVQYIKGR